MMHLVAVFMCYLFTASEWGTDEVVLFSGICFLSPAKIPARSLLSVFNFIIITK